MRVILRDILHVLSSCLTCCFAFIVVGSGSGGSAVKYKFDVKRKKYDYKTVIECVKDVKYIYWVKKDLFGCIRIEENVTKTMKQL